MSSFTLSQSKGTKPKPLHRHLHLQHHHHTGKLLHHRHTSYRGLAIVFVLSALFIVGLNVLSRVTADSLYVYARNPAPIPSTAAVITSPSDGTVVHNASLTISGTCPVVTPRVIIAILDNGTELGSVACDSSNQFSIAISLNYGDHTLIARSYTITDDAGPDSTPVHVSHPDPGGGLVPVPITTTTETTVKVPGKYDGVTPLVLTNTRPFMVYGPSKDALWVGHVSGGLKPYKMTINWGDGHTETHVLADATEQYLRHHYRQMQSYDVMIIVTDESGQRLVWHTAAVTPYTPPVSTFLITNGDSWLWRFRWFGIYGVYLLLLAFFGYLWVRAHPYAYAKVPVHRHVAAARRKARRT